MTQTHHGPPGRRTAAQRLTAMLGAAATVGVLALAPAPAVAAILTNDVTAPADAALGSRFTLAVLPDTQFYSRYSEDQFLPRYGSDPFATQTAWLVDHREELNIPFVAHLGDIVDQVGTEKEWRAADRAMATLDDAGMPYSILAGNHDVLNSSDDWFDTDYTLADEPFVQWFGTERAAKQSTYGGSDDTGFNQFHIFEAAGQEFLVLALSWRASDESLAWAQDVLAAHPTLPTILTTHSLLNIEPDGTSPKEDPNGLRLWEKLIRSNDQIFLTFNGHFHGATQLTKTNDFGNPVTEVLMDYQMAYEGGNGYLGLLEFDLGANTISLETGSPWVASKPRDMLTSYDQVLLEGEQQRFTMPIVFAERFRGFAPNFAAGPADQPSLTAKAREILLDGFEAPDSASLEFPGSSEDYVPVDGTLAHWRFGGAEGVVAEGQVFEDVAGGADLHRVGIAESGSATAQAADVTVSADTNPYSSDGGAVCFANSDKRTGRLSYLSTDADAAINDVNLDKGYTIETFLKVDPGWSADANGWMKAIVRSGNRSTMPGMPWMRWDYTASPAALGLSNLKELQWTEVPVDTTKGDRTSWSGEIMPDRWIHVALVNDPQTSRTTMYIDGAPVLRNATDTFGQSVNGAMPWIFGADWFDDRVGNGWAGCIGETRVIDHPTGPEQWLTARPSLTGFTALASETEVVAGQQAVLHGTGTPRAEVTLSGALAGQAQVSSDGRWSIELETSSAAARAVAILPGEHHYTATQSFGTRQSAPVAGVLRVAETSTPDPETPDPGTPGTQVPDAGTPAPGGSSSDPTQPGSGHPSDGGGQAGTVPGGDGSLAITGAGAVDLACLAAAVLALGIVLLVIKRRTARMEL
ncbi:LamG-like jellyroll fold domain-containing protein [Sanguibacter gelidistatuariae]|uniref:LamG-like jellyroll fold domain-containing protein n=1 Tax=Sanguibacter gelidistatuariae TaxID=1814289 RepID=UPI001C3133FE|nr:metallophosphoesterase [Sanguibacter gelidistatuariae]